MKDHDLVALDSVVDGVPETADIRPPDTGHLSLLFGVGVCEHLGDGGIDAVSKRSGARRSMLDEIGNTLFEFERCRVSIAYLHARDERAFCKIAATCSSLANLPSRMAVSPRSMPFLSSSLSW